MTVMLEQKRIEDAVRSAENLHLLRAYLTGVLDTGADRETLETVLRKAHDHFQELGHTEEADLSLDALDLLVGWCSPAMRIPEPQAA